MTIIEILEARIAELEPKAESGEDHADLCLLYEEVAEERRKLDVENGQFGAGA